MLSRHFFFSYPVWAATFIAYLTLFIGLPCAKASDSSSIATIRGTNAEGVSTLLLVDRDPALYTGDFGDCMGGQSLINLTSFDAAYYADNMTVLFNMVGSSNLRNESLMIYISVQAYGEDRFNLVFNPCNANFASVPILGQALIPVSRSDVANIPSVALNIPDFEGSAILRIFSNSTQTQIACFSAVMRNGSSLSHPGAIGAILVLFTFVGIISSFSNAIYGLSISQTRNHYAHSLSVLVIFEVFQSIFFSSALSLNWPSILTAWWSNFALFSGMIYSPGIINSLNKFVGISGNSSQAGGAGSTVLSNNGGLQQRIYGRSLSENSYGLRSRSEGVVNYLSKRSAASENHTKLYDWAGVPVSPGLPLPGNWSGFAGELSLLGIPAADAFLNGLIWLLILALILCVSLALLKGVLEGLSSLKWIKENRLKFFRAKWLGYLGQALLRTGFIAFFMIMTLTLYQFSYGGRAGPIAIAVLVFIFAFFGYLGLSFYACYNQTKFCRDETQADDAHIHRNFVMDLFLNFKTTQKNKIDETDKVNHPSPDSDSQVKAVDKDIENTAPQLNVVFLERFGWLSARYRRTRWWFFAVWIVYQFVRACLVGGARAHPAAQVVGLFTWEILALIGLIILNPYEGTRNSVLAFWMIGISKVITSGLSIAFLPRLKVARISTTVIGVLIIIIQGLLVVGLLALITIGAVSSYMSLTRDSEHVKPKNLQNIRLKYFDHIDVKANNRPRPATPEPEKPKEPYFSVNNVRREPKIEDESPTPIPSIYNPTASFSSLPRHEIPTRPFSRVESISGSIQSQIPNSCNRYIGTHARNSSWSSRDLNELPNDLSRSSTQNGFYPSGPLIRPSTPMGSLRLLMPSPEQQRQCASQRMNNVK